MTQDHRKLNAAFLKLAEQEAAGAPPRVEAALLKAFRRRRRVRTAAWFGAGSALTAFAAAVLLYVSVPDIPAPTAPRPYAARMPAPAVQLPVVVPARLTRRAVRPPKYHPLPLRFYALSAADVPLESGQVVRVELPRSALATAGFPMDERRRSEPIQADVLLGQDGVARAIRFIQ